MAGSKEGEETRKEKKYFESSASHVFFMNKMHTLHASFAKNKKFSGGTRGNTGASAVTVPTIDFCHHEPCMMRGKCVSRQDRYECHCYAQYSGNNCQNDNGRLHSYLVYVDFTTHMWGERIHT